MQLTYYNNTTDKRYLVKKITQLSLAEHANPVTIKMLESCSIAKPIFKMKDVDLYMTANYCYVDSLHRYHYIDDITLENGFAYLHCTCDVLMSYARVIGGIDVIVERNEIDYNLYQADNEMMINNYTSFQRIEFAKGFDKNKQNFIMCVIGNTSTEPPSGGSSSSSSGDNGDNGGSSGGDGIGTVDPGGII